MSVLCQGCVGLENCVQRRNCTQFFRLVHCFYDADGVITEVFNADDITATNDKDDATAGINIADETKGTNGYVDMSKAVWTNRGDYYNNTAITLLMIQLHHIFGSKLTAQAHGAGMCMHFDSMLIFIYKLIPQF